MWNTSRIWSEQDFSQLYEEQPKIINSSTYFTVSLEIQDIIVPVKIPSKASLDIVQFLLYKVVYFHLLNTKHQHPLLKTAQISCFEGKNGYRVWYEMSEQGVVIPKNSILQCVKYSKEQSLIKFIPLAVIQQQKSFSKILVRSRLQGKYRNIYIYPFEKSCSESFSEIFSAYSHFQHPFLTKLIEKHKTPSHNYFVFEHCPYSLTQILNGNQKLKKQQVQIFFSQLILALNFLEQQQIYNWKIDIDAISIDRQGHLKLNQKVIGKGRGEDNFQFLKEIFGTLVCIMDENQQGQECKTLLQFSGFLAELAQASIRRRVFIKEILTHKWMQQKQIQSVLSKNKPLFNPSLIKSQQRYKQMTPKQSQSFYSGYFQHKFSQIQYQSCEIHSQTQNQKVLAKYLIQNSPRVSSRSIKKLLKPSPSSGNIRSIEDPNIRMTHQVSESTIKSPYYSILKKQGSLKRKKPILI